MRWNRHRLGAEEGHIAGKREKHTPLGPKNDSDSHVAQDQSAVVVNAEKKKTRLGQDNEASKARLLERRVSSWLIAAAAWRDLAGSLPL